MAATNKTHSYSYIISLSLVRKSSICFFASAKIASLHFNPFTRKRYIIFYILLRRQSILLVTRAPLGHKSVNNLFFPILSSVYSLGSFEPIVTQRNSSFMASCRNKSCTVSVLAIVLRKSQVSFPRRFSKTQKHIFSNIAGHCDISFTCITFRGISQ